MNHHGRIRTIGEDGEDLGEDMETNVGDICNDISNIHTFIILRRKILLKNQLKFCTTIGWLRDRKEKSLLMMMIR